MADIAFFEDATAPVQADQYALEFQALLDIYREQRPMNVLEIGVRHGGTFWQWIHHAPRGALVIGVDLPGGAWGDLKPIDYRTVWGNAGAARVCAVTMLADSHHPVTLRAIRAMMPVIDFLFIDGDHTERGAELDYLMYGSMVQHGGIIAFHDVLFDPDCPGIEVYKVFEMVRHAHLRSEILTSADGQTNRGIGVIYAR